MAIILDGTAGEQLSGNLTFTGTGQRITGDFNNSTIANRPMFQSSVTNANTTITAIPNGTGTITQFQANSSSDPTNGSTISMLMAGGSDGRLVCGITGTGTYLPMAFYTNNTLQMLINTDGTITGTKGNLQLISGTAVASTSGTSIDFTGIPSWAKRITVMFNGVSTNGTSNFLIQLGNGSVVTSGYTGVSSSGTAVATNSTAGFIVSSNQAAVSLYNGIVTISNVSGNIWAESGTIGSPSNVNTVSSGVITLGGALDRIRITTVNGTDTFDAGSINIMYE